LTGMLRDTSSMWEKAQPEEIRPELRDCALAALAKMNAKELGDFGLIKTVNWTVNFTNPKQQIVMQLYGFATDEARRKGFEKWTTEPPKK
jgi:hypothetical protein